MSPPIEHTTQVKSQDLGSTSDGFDLDVTLIEVTDTTGLISLTNDGCGSTCGACTTNVA